MLRVVSFGVAHLLLLATCVSAQPAVTSELRGTVTDQTGGVMVGAPVMLEDAHGQKWTATTDQQGHYALAQLTAGAYSLTVNPEGFKVFTARVNLRPGQTTTRDVGLKLAIAVSVDVNEGTGISTDPRRSRSSLVLTGAALEALPDDPQLFMERLLQLAGASGKPGDVAITVDGFAEYKLMPPKQAIEMIRINSNSFSAEFAARSAKRIEITTKPGSDSFHGDARGQFRNSALNAQDPMTTTKPPMSYQGYNGYLQGPIQKGRMDFLAYGGLWRQNENATVNATVLDPRTLEPEALSTTVSTPTSVESALFQLHFKVRRQLFNVSFARTNQTYRNGGLDGSRDMPERAYDSSSNDNVARLAWTVIGARAINDVHVEVTRSSYAALAQLTTPGVSVLDAFNGGGNPLFAGRTSTTGVQANDTLTFQRGSHMLKTGVQFAWIKQDSMDRSGFGGSFVFGADVERDSSGNPVLDASGQSISISPIEDYRRTLLGLPGYGPSQFSIVGGNPSVGVTQAYSGWFAQDDWSISKRLALSYGIRQELQTNIGMRVNLAPRASLAWTPDKAEKSAIKIGTGLFYTPVDSGITLDTSRLDGSRQLELIVAHPAFYNPIPPSLALTPPSESSVHSKANDLRMPDLLVSSITFERELKWGLWGIAQYTVERGAHLLRMRNLTAPAPGAPTAAPPPPVFQFESSGRSLGRELMLSIRGSIRKTFSVFGNYTLGEKDSDTDGAHSQPANAFDLSTEYGPAGTDQRHQLVAGASMEAGWGLSLSPYVAFSSGRPFNITTGRDNNNDASFTDRPTFALPGDPRAIATPYGLLNPDPQPGDPVIPRNFGREPSQLAVNLVVSKTFSGMTMTWDVENVFNATRLVGSNGVITSPAFGMPNRALNGRRVGVTIRYGF